MLMVVLGAGASYDSAVEIVEPGAADDYRPPLANQLFENREVFLPIRKNFPEINPIIGYIPSGRGKPVEQVLQQLQSEAVRYPERYKQLAAVRFYLQYLLTEIVDTWYDPALRGKSLGRLASSHGATNQLSLIDQLQLAALPEPVCLVTFNYDTLIEKALSHFGRPTRALGDYTTSDRFKLFKLHGSVNWGRPVSAPLAVVDSPWSMVRTLIERAATLRVADEFLQVDNVVPLSLFNGVPLLPAIAIPVQTKIDFECPAEHITMLRDLIPKTTGILTIGWRGTEQHFLDLLRELVATPVHLAVCADSGPNANTTLTHLRAYVGTATTQIFEHGFRHMIAEGELTPFLARIQSS